MIRSALLSRAAAENLHAVALFKRALKAITGEETYYRWGPAVSARKGD